MTREKRRLAAIVSADVAEYSRLIGVDESGTLAALKAHRRKLIDPKIAEHRGRIVKTTGDGLLLEFASVVDAVRCAVDVQRGMAKRNAGVSPDRRVDFRIGINVGDIIIDGDDIFGDGVNVAARVQALAKPGAIYASRVVRDQVMDKLAFTFEDLGAHAVKNIARPVEVYRVDLGPGAQTPGRDGWFWARLKQSSIRSWPAAGLVALGVAGIAVWGWAHFWNVVPSWTAPPLSVAMAPLSAPQGDAGASRFAEDLTHDVMTGLSLRREYGQLRVVSGGSTAVPENSAPNAHRLGQSLHVRYVLEGDVLSSGVGYAVNLRLVDTTTGGQVWSERNTLEDSDVSAVSSTRLRNEIERLRAAIVSAETLRVMAQPSSRLNAQELVLRASAVWERDPSLAGAIEAKGLADAALRLEPNLVPALISRAIFANYEGDVDPNQDRDRIGREQDEFTARAVSLDRNNPDAWKWRGIALEYLGRWDAALDANAEAIKLEPDNPWFYITRAWTMSMMGRPTEGLILVDRALAMEPAPAALGWALRVACEANLLAGHAEQAIATCEKAVGLDNDWMNNLFLAAAYANHGDLAKAAAAKAQVLRIVPGYTIMQLRAKRYSDHPEYRRLAEINWYKGLRSAGIPEQ